MTWTIQLDPPAVATGRSVLDLSPTAGNAIQVDAGGIDWGDAAITAYQANETVWGSSVISYRVPNRQVSIPLFVGADNHNQGEAAKAALQEKVALFQRHGGWILRQRAGGLAMYADVVNATLTFPDQYMDTAGLQPSVRLMLECLPDFYGDPITLNPISGAGATQAMLTSGYANYVPNPAFAYDATGSAPALWSSTTPVWWLTSGATLTVSTSKVVSGSSLQVVTTVASASEGAAISLGVLPAGTYTVSAYIAGNVGGETVTLFGGMTSPGTGDGSTNVTLTGAMALYSVTFTANGSARIFVGVRSQAAQAITFFIDDVMVNSGATPNAYVDGDTSSAYAWSGTPGASATGVVATIQGDHPGRASMTILEGSGSQQFGLVWGYRSYYYSSASNAQLVYPAATSCTPASGATVSALAGANAGKAISRPVSSAAWTQVGSFTGSHTGTYQVWVRVYCTATGGLVQWRWGLGDAAQIASNDYVALPGSGNFYLLNMGQIRLDPVPIGNQQWMGQLWAETNSGSGNMEWDMLYLQPLDEGGGALEGIETSNPVMIASGTCALRFDGVYRSVSGGTVYNPVPQVLGDLPRIPPSGSEGLPVQLFMKNSRGDLQSFADSGTDSFSVTVQYRPCWLFRP